MRVPGKAFGRKDLIDEWSGCILLPFLQKSNPPLQIASQDVHRSRVGRLVESKIVPTRRYAHPTTLHQFSEPVELAADRSNVLDDKVFTCE